MAPSDPRGWSVATLGEIALSAVDGPFGSNLKTEHYVSQPGVRVVRLQNIERGDFNDNDRAWVSESHARTLERHEVRPGDILVASLGDENHPFGRACLYPNQAAGIVKADCFRLRLNGARAVPGYVMRVLNSDSLRADLNRLGQGVTRDRVNLGNLLRFRVPVPPLPDQRRIAEILDTLDEAIRKTEQLIAKLKQVKQGLLHDLLTRGVDDNGELRDPDRHPEQFKDSPLGLIPQSWDVAALRELGSERIINGVFKAPSRVGTGIPLVNVGDLYAEFGVELGGVERFRATATEQRRFAVAPGDVFFTRSSLALGGIAHCNIVRDVPEAAVFECHLMRLRPNLDRVVPEFVAHWCRSPVSREFLMGRAKQVTMTTISQPDVAPLPVPVPLLGEQRRVVEILDSHEQRLRWEAEQRDKLGELKRALMEDLLSGKVRVTPLADEVAA